MRPLLAIIVLMVLVLATQLIMRITLPRTHRIILTDIVLRRHPTMHLPMLHRSLSDNNRLRLLKRHVPLPHLDLTLHLCLDQPFDPKPLLPHKLLHKGNAQRQRLLSHTPLRHRPQHPYQLSTSYLS